MFKLYHSNRLDLLKDLLAILMDSDPLSDPFEDEQILVQSPGMAQWLKLELAKASGISANINFPLPASFIWDMFKVVLPGVPEKSPFNKEAMAWKLMQLLPQFLEYEEFAPLARYLSDDKEQRKRYQLSHKVADIFDQYLVYRPQWMDAWEQGQAGPDWVEEQAWQPILWRALVDEVKESHSEDSKAYHRAGLYQDFIDRLNRQMTVPGLPKRLFVFGISALPPKYVEALVVLGKHMDVHLMLSNPCQEYWSDIVDPKYLAKKTAQNRTLITVENNELLEEQGTPWLAKGKHYNEMIDQGDAYQVGNPILASMGKLVRDFLHQLSILEPEEVQAFVELPGENLLQQIQKDILELKDASESEQGELDSCEHRRILDIQDTSLEMVACHSPMREVEVLQDKLLGMFAENPELTPKDIIVMMPNVEDYSPYIWAVFGSETQSKSIPFSISDVSAKQENPVLSSFLKLLKLSETRCTSAELLEILEVPAILARFDIAQQEFERIRQWVLESGIRWGLNDLSGERFDLPNLTHNTWLFGLRRMLLGYAMSEHMFDGILPYEECQGIEAELLGKLCSFVEELILAQQSLSQQQDIVQWQQALNQILERFYLGEESDELALKLIRDKLENLHQQIKQADFQEFLSLAVLYDYLSAALTNERSSQRFLAGQVNFCTLMPMRSIPFKVVCLLGMNDGVYPRSIPDMGFDLMAGHTEKGDRSRRDDDRYLFLEALISAQDKLYISFVGHSIQDNSEKVPSVLVTELLDYCLQSYVLVQDRDKKVEEALKGLENKLVTHYPLQAFSRRYFNGEFSTYGEQWWSTESSEVVNKSFLGEPLPELDLEQEPIELESLVRFYRHPNKTFLNQRLKVYLELKDQTIEEDEPFFLDGLANYHLATEVLDTLLTDGSTTEVETRLRASGQLPFSAFGALAYERQVEKMGELADQVKPFVKGEEQQIEVALQIGEEQLEGWLKSCYQGQLIRVKPAALNGKDIVQSWIEHLCLCASSQHVLPSLLFGRDEAVSFAALESSYAKEKLALFISYYRRGLLMPLPFFPNTALAWSKQQTKKDPCALLQQDWDSEQLEKARGKALDRFNGTFVLLGEGDDPYIQRCYPELEPHLAKFEVICCQLFGPLLDNMEPIKED